MENLASIWSKKRGRREDWATSFREEVCASGNLVPRRTRGRHKKGRCPRRSDRHLEFLGGAEGYLFAGLDLDRLTGHRIAAHAGSAITHHQNSEPGDFHPLTLLQVFGDHADELFHHFQALLLAELMLLRQRICQMFGGDRLWGRWLC